MIFMDFIRRLGTIWVVNFYVYRYKKPVTFSQRYYMLHFGLDVQSKNDNTADCLRTVYVCNTSGFLSVLTGPDIRYVIGNYSYWISDNVERRRRLKNANGLRILWRKIFYAGCIYGDNFYRFISVFNQLDAQNLFHNKFYFMPLHVSSTCAHHREVKIALHSLWYHHTYRWSSLNPCTRRPPIGVMIPEVV